jgi:hypothetical protein
VEHGIAEEARAMLQGVGSRFDFHMNKTLCDLRFVGATLDDQVLLSRSPGPEKFSTSL